MNNFLSLENLFDLKLPSAKLSADDLKLANSQLQIKMQRVSQNTAQCNYKLTSVVFNTVNNFDEEKAEFNHTMYEQLKNLRYARKNQRWESDVYKR
jgi:D-ribose pyranose/furanose isomerase RbsD